MYAMLYSIYDEEEDNRTQRRLAGPLPLKVLRSSTLQKYPIRSELLNVAHRYPVVQMSVQHGQKRGS